MKGLQLEEFLDVNHPDFCPFSFSLLEQIFFLLVTEALHLLISRLPIRLVFFEVRFQDDIIQ